MSRVSIREGRRLRKRVAELEGQLAALRNRYALERPGTRIQALVIGGTETIAVLRCARKLGFGIAAVPDDQGDGLSFYAVPPK